MDELNNTDTWQIYPNPTHDLMHLDINENIESISVYNSNSQLVHDVPTNRSKRIVDFSKLPRGIYLIRISTPNRTIDKKIILTEE